MNKMLFPGSYSEHRYSKIHFNFFIQYAMLANIDIEFKDDDERIFIGEDNQLLFSCVINGKQAIFDYADHHNRKWHMQYPGIPYFKFQTNRESLDHTIALGPPIVGIKNNKYKSATLQQYFTLKENFNYQPGTSILCKQHPNGAAFERRIQVQSFLKYHYDDIDLDPFNDQIEFWKSHEECGVAVCVPGATNNMIDRGQMELFGLGVCTISPSLNTILPYNTLAIPGVHYIKCQSDYSDLGTIINTLLKDPILRKSIGNGAKHLFDTRFSPHRYWNWILSNL